MITQLTDRTRQVLDDGGGSSDEGEQNTGPSPMETNNDIAPNTFKGKSWLTEPNPHPSTQVTCSDCSYILGGVFPLFSGSASKR